MGENTTAFGRQVIFINPSYLAKTIIIQKLLEMEYEVYYVENPRYTKNLLNKFPHAICLIDVDSAMASEEYLNLIASIEKAPEYEDVLIAVLTRRMASLQKRYSEVLKVKAGYINTASSKDALLDELNILFASYEVKGRRQFVRVSLPPGSGAQFYCKIQGIPTHFPLRDISSCGFACEAKGYPEAAFTIKSLIKGELQLGTNILPCSVVLFTIKNVGKSLMLVMLFDQSNAWSNKKTIRSFVADMLQRAVDDVRLNSPIDETDYSKGDEEAGKKSETDGNPDEAQTENSDAPGDGAVSETEQPVDEQPVAEASQ